MGRLEGKVAIITGAASGIGEAEARAFAKEGAKVTMVTSRRKEDMAKIAAEIEAAGGEVITILADVSKEESWKEIVDATLAKWGKINILVNNAAVRPFGTIETTDAEEMRRALDINVVGPMLGMKAVVPHMKASGEPCAIMNTSSLSGVRKGQPDALPYSATKAAIVGMSRSAARDLEGTNIRLNILHPGLILTPMNINGSMANEDFRKRVANTIPVGRVGTPEDMVGGAIFLCSDEALYVHGDSLYIDGGLALR